MKKFLTIAAVAALSVSQLSFSMNIIEKMEKTISSEEQLYAEVEKLINEGKIDVNKLAQDGQTVLYWACSKNNPKLANVILPKCTANTINRIYKGTLALKALDHQYNDDISLAQLLVLLKTLNLHIKHGLDATFVHESAKNTDIATNNSLEENKKILILKAVKTFRLANDLDNLASNQDTHFKIPGFIDSQNNDETVDILCGRLYAIYGIKYNGIKNSLNLPKNTRGLNKFKDCKVITPEQDEIL